MIDLLVRLARERLHAKVARMHANKILHPEIVDSERAEMIQHLNDEVERLREQEAEVEAIFSVAAERLAEIERLRADAERYQYIKSMAHKDTGWPEYEGYRHWFAIYDHKKVGFDAVIDVAMREARDD